MQIITLILAVLALGAGVSALAIGMKAQLQHEELRDSVDAKFTSLAAKRKKQQEAMIHYVNVAAEEARAKAVNAVQEQICGCQEDLDGLVNQICGIESGIEKTRRAVQAANNKAVIALKIAKDFSGRIEKLEQGVVPDYNEAMRAVNAVNDMNSGIAGIFGFDPLEALKKSRQEGK